MRVVWINGVPVCRYVFRNAEYKMHVTCAETNAEIV